MKKEKDLSEKEQRKHDEAKSRWEKDVKETIKQEVMETDCSETEKGNSPS